MDIYEVAEACRAGEITACIEDGAIYLQDEKGSRVRLETIRQDHAQVGQRDDSLRLGPYNGFMMIQCEECGEVSAYCARKDTYSSRCRKCGHETTLEGLRIMHAHCKCGRSFKYKTNLTDRYVSHTCMDCGAPIDMELNRRGTAYVTIGYVRHRED